MFGRKSKCQFVVLHVHICDDIRNGEKEVYKSILIYIGLRIYWKTSATRGVRILFSFLSILLMP